MNKFEKAQEILRELGGDGWLIICVENNDINSRFMLGVESPSRHYIYVAADGNHKIMAVEMEAPMIERSLKKKGVKAEVFSYKSMKELNEFLSPIVKKTRVALDFGENVLSPEGTGFADLINAGDYLSMKKLAPQTEFISAAPIIEALRSVKTPSELMDLRNVCKATIEILETLPDWVKVGMTENDIKAKLEYEYMKLGRTSFGSIVATGAHSADPHHNTSLKKIKQGVLLIDSGLQINEMSSDITRTYWVGAYPPEDFNKAYAALYGAKNVANDYFTDGSPKNLPALKCRAHLTAKGYDHEKLFIHGLGHSLGFVAHDIGKSASWKMPETYKFKENMVFTNEPGLYWKDKWGIRLEDNVIIGKGKCEQVTKVSEIPILI